MRLRLNLNYLSKEDINILLPRINLIKDKIYPVLEVEADDTYGKGNCWIKVDQQIEDMDKALTLFKLFNNLNHKHKGEFQCILIETRKGGG